MRRSARNYADVARWFFRSRFFAVAPSLSANVAVAPARSAIPPAGPLCPSTLRCPSLTQRRVDVKTAMYWTGAMQLRKFHAPVEEHPPVNDFFRKKPRILRDTIDYGREMRRLLREGSYSRVLVLFDEMKSRRIGVDVMIYTAVMKAHSRMNNVDMVKRVFNEIEMLGLEPDKYLFNTLIYAYINTGEVDAAFEVFRKMREDCNIPPDSVAYRSLVIVCGKGKDVDRARETFNEMIEKFRTIDVRDFNAMLEVYAENADSDTGEAYLQECKELMAAMKSKGIKPQAFTYVPLIKLCGKLGRLDEALGYLKESVSSDAEVIPASFSFLFRSLADLQLTDEEFETHVVYCFDRMAELKMKPSHFTFGAIIDLYEVRGDVSNALEFLMKLSKTSNEIVGLSRENFASQLEIVQRLWDCGRLSQEEALAKATEVLETMKSLDVSMSYRGYKIWFTMCLKASDVKRAFECWNDFMSGDRWPSAGMTQFMIRLALDHDRVNDAVRVLKFLQNEKKIMLTKDTYEAILAHCAEKSDTETAKTVFECMQEAKVKPNEATQEHLATLQLV